MKVGVDATAAAKESIGITATASPLLLAVLYQASPLVQFCVALNGRISTLRAWPALFVLAPITVALASMRCPARVLCSVTDRRS